VLVTVICAVVAAGALAGAPTSTAPVGDSCATLLPNSVFASIFPAYNGQPPTRGLHFDDPQSWTTKTRETWKVGSSTTSGPISFTHTLPGTSTCFWFHNLAVFHVWYALRPGGASAPATLDHGWAGSPTEAWDRYSSGAGPNGTGSRITNGKALCPGGTPAAGYDQRECATQPVSGIGDQAAEGFGYVVFQEKGNTYEIGSYVNNASSRYVLPYDALEALARKVAVEVAASPAPVINVTCAAAAAGYPQECGPKPYR